MTTTTLTENQTTFIEWYISAVKDSNELDRIFYESTWRHSMSNDGLDIVHAVIIHLTTKGNN